MNNNESWEPYKLARNIYKRHGFDSLVYNNIGLTLRLSHERERLIITFPKPLLHYRVANESYRLATFCRFEEAGIMDLLTKHHIVISSNSAYLSLVLSNDNVQQDYHQEVFIHYLVSDSNLIVDIVSSAPPFVRHITVSSSTIK